MSPQEIAALSTALQALQEFGKLPLGTLLVIVLVLPWVSLLIYTWLNNRLIDKFREQFREETDEARKRFEAVVRMYEDNVMLVKNYEKMSGDQQDLIISNTTTMQRLVDKMEAR
jgi:hypothetical protein